VAIIFSRRGFSALASYVLTDLLTSDGGPIELGVWLFACKKEQGRILHPGKSSAVKKCRLPGMAHLVRYR
jgi:hypothetical protein